MWTVTYLEAKPRQDLQALAKARGIRANSKSSQIIDDLLAWARANHKDETKVDVDNKKTSECCKKQARTHSAACHVTSTAFLPVMCTLAEHGTLLCHFLKNCSTFQLLDFLALAFLCASREACHILLC
jgi:hypothetical protein